MAYSPNNIDLYLNKQLLFFGKWYEVDFHTIL